MNAGTAGNTDDTDWNADFFWNADDAGDADFILERGWTRVTRILFWNADDAGDADDAVF
jgi:hypothetical protein